MVHDHGPLFLLSAAYLYLFHAGSTAVAGLGAFRSRHAYRSCVLLPFTAGLPLVGNIGYIVFGFPLSGADPTLFPFSFALLTFTWLIFIKRIFDITTIAKETLFFRTPNPMANIELNGAVPTANAEARTLLRPPGTRAGGTTSAWPLLAGPAAEADSAGRGVCSALPGIDHFTAHGHLSHAAGDVVLRRFAHLLRADAQLRAAKRLGRTRSKTVDVALAGGFDDRRSG